MTKSAKRWDINIVNSFDCRVIKLNKVGKKKILKKLFKSAGFLILGLISLALLIFTNVALLFGLVEIALFFEDNHKTRFSARETPWSYLKKLIWKFCMLFA